MEDKSKNDAHKSGSKPEKVIRTDSIKKEKDISNLIRSKVVVSRSDSLIIEPSLFEYFFESFYNFLYIIGIEVLRKLKKIVRMLRSKAQVFLITLISVVFGVSEYIYRQVKNLFRRIKLPFSNIYISWKAEELNRQISKENGEIPWKSVGRVTQKALSDVWSVLRTVLNHAIPLVALIIFITVVRQGVQKELVLHVTYKDQKLGYIRSERDFGEALNEVSGRIVADLKNNYTAGAPFFQVAEFKEGMVITDKDSLINGIIRASNADVVEAYGLYANEDLVGAVRDSKAVLDEIERIRKENESGKPEEQIQFEKKIAFRSGLYPAETIVEDSELIEIINSTETSDETYISVEGDTVTSVALKMGITTGVLRSLNPSVEAEELEIGTSLYISKARRFLTIKTIFTDIRDEDIDYSIIENKNALYAESYRRIESPGVKGKARVTYEVVMIDGVIISEVVLKQTKLSDPISEIVTIGAYDHPDKEEKGFMWPGRGGYVSAAINGYPGHTGMDIAGTGGVGSPVYASASGTVVQATYSGVGYGNYLKIDHGNGFVTLYAHNSQLYVKAGDRVAKGQIIAAVGSTGRSSGPHIHIEVILNGQYKNPADYIGTSP